jgi:hypothetical protein
MHLARTSTLALAAALTVMAPTAAEAATYHHTDSTHDVVMVPDEGSTTTPEPTRMSGDILGSTVIHGKNRVVMQMRYAQLVKTNDFVFHYFSVATNKNKVRNFLLFASPGKLEGRVSRETGKGKPFRCKGVHWSIRYASGTATVSVPRRCLGRPKWVRVSMAEVESQDSKTYADDANSATLDTSSVGPVRGPRVYR